MKNKDIHEWLLDNSIDCLLTIKDNKGSEIYLTDLILKYILQMNRDQSMEDYAVESCIRQRSACALWIEDARVLDCPLVTDEQELK